MAEKNNNTTLDDLAEMIKAGFDNTATKDDHARLEKKVDGIDDRLRLVETKLDKAFYADINRIEVRVKKLEEKVGMK